MAIANKNPNQIVGKYFNVCLLIRIAVHEEAIDLI
jgi:hypothetical protein